MTATFRPGDEENEDDEMPQGGIDVEETPGTGPEAFGIGTKGFIGVDSSIFILLRETLSKQLTLILSFGFIKFFPIFNILFIRVEKMEPEGLDPVA